MDKIDTLLRTGTDDKTSKIPEKPTFCKKMIQEMMHVLPLLSSNTHLLRHLAHAHVSWRATVVQEERCLPVVVVRLQQVPAAVARSHQPHVLRLLATARDDASLQHKYHFQPPNLAQYN